MERKITLELTKWKKDKLKKPLLLYGVPGCGKTYTTLEFGRTQYKNLIYFDCSNNLELNYVFEKNTSLEKLIRGLSAISLETILKEESLVIFDNVSEKVLKSVRKLFSQDNSYHIIMISNDQEIVKNGKSTDITIKKMNLVDFSEYLKYTGKEQMIDFIIDSFKNNKPMPFHNMAFESFNDYVLTGGYPNAIVNYKESGDLNLLSSFHEKNIAVIKSGLLSLDSLIDIKRSIEVFDSVSLQLLKDNKKFLYGMIKPGGRAKDYVSSIDFMTKNNLLIKCNKISDIISPLNKQKDDESFKLYYNDSGILLKKMNVCSNKALTNEKLLNIIYENNVASTLSQNGFNLYYYHSDGKSEMDLVLQTRTGKLIPIEFLKDEVSTRSKSMSVILAKYDLQYAIRFTYGNFRIKNKIAYVPYYASFCITEMM